MVIKLVIFDIDGTLFQTNSWQYIHQNLNTWHQARKHFNKFFKKKISYTEWAKLDAELWKKQPVTRINQIINKMPYTKGAKETIISLKQKGIKIHLLSAGLTRAAERIHYEIGVNGFTANTLLAKDGLLTGEVKVNVSFNDKNKHLPSILKKFNVTPQECAAVGDDPTLIPLFLEVALSIAFNPTEKKVGENADVTIQSEDLRDILPHITCVKHEHN